MKQFLALGLSQALALIRLAPSAAAEGDSPASWAAAEVSRAVKLGLASEAVQRNWQATITRGSLPSWPSAIWRRSTAMRTTRPLSTTT